MNDRKDIGDAPAILHWIDWGILIFFATLSVWRVTGPDPSRGDWIALAFWLSAAALRLSGWYVGFENWRPKLKRDRWIRGEK